MRYNVVKEGKPYPDGRAIELGAIHMPDGKENIPVTMTNSGGPIVGFAEDLQRDDDGNVSLDIFITDVEPLRGRVVGDFDFGFSLEVVMWNEGNDMGIVRAAFIRCVHLQAKGVIPNAYQPPNN